MPDNNVPPVAVRLNLICPITSRLVWIETKEKFIAHVYSTNEGGHPYVKCPACGQAHYVK